MPYSVEVIDLVQEVPLLGYSFALFHTSSMVIYGLTYHTA